MEGNNSNTSRGFRDWLFQFSLLLCPVAIFSESTGSTTLTNPRIENLVNIRWKRQICCCCPIMLTCCVVMPPIQTAPVVRPILPPVPKMEPVPISLPISGPRPVIMAPLSLLTLPPQPIPVLRPVAVPTLQPFPISGSFGMTGVSCCVCCMPVCVQECIIHCTTTVCGGGFGRKKRAIAMNKYYYASDRLLLT